MEQTKHNLRLGDLNLTYEKGSIRWIKLNDSEIIRMIYSAVRDCNWGTIEPVILDEQIHIFESAFNIILKVEYKADPIHYIANYRIIGNENTIRFEMDGIALSDFLKNRIGFCILHPIKECKGKEAKVVHTDGNTSLFIFPEIISPHQPVKAIQSMTWERADGITATLTMKGDIFEMEDQRNWTDASYKTYCTPLELPFPAQIKKGETVSQMVELQINSDNIKVQSYSDFVFSWNNDKTYPIPSLGTSISSRKEELKVHESELLKKLPLDHLRVEIKMDDANFKDSIEKAYKESELLGWELFIVLYLSENYKDEYYKFSSICKLFQPRVKWLLPISKNHLSLPEFDEFYPLIKQDFPHWLIGTGVNAYFAELNRCRTSIEKADFVAFTICPQVHAFDNASLVENLEAQAEVIRSAQLLFPGKPVHISPVSLKQRFNVVATSEELLPPNDQLPPSVDQRQRLNFTAAWTLGSLKFLAQSRAELVTYYETVGWKGWIQGEIEPLNSKLFPAESNEIFPVYKAIKELSGFSTIIHSESSHPLMFDGLVLKSDKELKILLFNFTEEDIVISLKPSILIKKINFIINFDTPQYSEGKYILKSGNVLEIIS